MLPTFLADHVTRALADVATYRPKPFAVPADESGIRPLTIAFSREEGVPVHCLAESLGKTLGWPVYDQELLDLVAKEMHVDARRLQKIDERNVDWLEEALDALMEVPSVSEGGFLAALKKAILRLGKSGRCIIVGRGSPHILPIATTLRVRCIATHQDRAATIAELTGLGMEAAAKQVDARERERNRFIRDHFFVDTADPLNYDLVLNLSHLKVNACLDLLVAAMANYRVEAAALA